MDPQGGHRVDAERGQVRRVEVQPDAHVGKPSPQLRGVGEVARLPVGVPHRHVAVLHDEGDVASTSLVDEVRQELRGCGEVVADSPSGVATDEHAHGADAEQARRVAAPQQVRADAITTVGVQQVLVARHPGDADTGRAYRLGEAACRDLVERLDVDVRRVVFHPRRPRRVSRSVYPFAAAQPTTRSSGHRRKQSVSSPSRMPAGVTTSRSSRRRVRRRGRAGESIGDAQVARC